VTDTGVPPYRRIAAGIAERIRDGTLRPGDRVPSTRQIITEYGVAMATASKVLAVLREQGLVRAIPGRGTVVADVTPGRQPEAARTPRGQPPIRERIVAAAITVADAEGLAALSMRRLAAELGAAPMSLYRHVADKDELLLTMMDTVFAANPLPDPGTGGWREQLEALCRLQWAMYRRHPWLAQAVSFTRPMLAPNAMAHTEWAMRALDGHGLDIEAQLLASVMLANYVRGTAVNLEAEANAEQESGLTEREWMKARQHQLADVLAEGKLPMMARYTALPSAGLGLDTLLEYGLQRLLDGLAPLVEAAAVTR
jgi:AcrR family transcriptional regulator